MVPNIEALTKNKKSLKPCLKNKPFFLMIINYDFFICRLDITIKAKFMKEKKDYIRYSMLIYFYNSTNKNECIFFKPHV